MTFRTKKAAQLATKLEFTKELAAMHKIVQSTIAGTKQRVWVRVLIP